MTDSNAVAPKRVALVGHCGPDSSFLRMAIAAVAPKAKVVSADSPAELEAAAGEADLVLFNRVLDFGFASDDGVTVLRDLKTRFPQAKVMMVSNFEQTQRDAEAAGALPGFGKREIGTGKARDRLAAVLGQSVTA